MGISITTEESDALLDFFTECTVSRNPFDGVHWVAHQWGISTTTATRVERVLRRAKKEKEINDAG